MRFEGFFVWVINLSSIMTLAILIELPAPIKKELSRIRTGLPSVEWNEDENLYILLNFIGKLTDTEKWDVIDKLGEVQIEPFHLMLNHLSYHPKRGNGGSLWIHTKESTHLNLLKKEISKHLRPVKLSSNNDHSSTKEGVRLGIVQKELPDRLALYFEANGPFTSSLFEIQSFVLAEIHQTDKRSFYTVVREYLLT